MKKVININFQGRVIPIEETAYDILKQYVDSLRRYFANEEGRDEIINDIEGRIAELFSETLKKGATCITDADVQSVMASMGRPEDLEAQDAAINGNTDTANTGSTQQETGSQQSTGTAYNAAPGHRKLVRNADDKIIAGVCSGLANYLRIDPVIMRILFVVLFFTGGSGFLVYLILWVAVPSQSIQANITKRLYRSADDKVFAGVCGGLAAYFNINTWVPRLIFALPLIIGLLSGPFNWFWGDMDFWVGPRVITGSLSSTLFVSYIILWIAVPIAVTAAEKLEMRGERVDLNSIRNTVKEDLESFKSKAQNWSNEVKQSAQQFGSKAREFGQSEHVKTFTNEATATARTAGSGIAHIIGVLFKAFFLFLVGVIALSLFGVLMAFLFGGAPLMAIKEFFLEGFWQNTFAFASIFLFLGVPVIAMITWLIRRIMGVRSKNHYLGYVFGTLWFIGIASAALLTGSLFRSFKSKNFVEETVSITQPSQNMLHVNLTPDNNHFRYYSNEWFGDWDSDWPLFGANMDSIFLKTVRVDVAKSNDNNYHVSKIKFSRGANPVIARNVAEKISFTTSQIDSTLYLPKGFAVSTNEKFRNQQVLIVVQVPVGKGIYLDNSVSDYKWFEMRNRRNGFDISDDWDRTYWVQTGRAYIMTPDGAKELSKLDPAALKRGEYKEQESKKHDDEEDNDDDNDDNKKQETKPASPAKDSSTNSNPNGGYRYHQNKSNDVKKDTSRNKSTAAVRTGKSKKDSLLFSLAGTDKPDAAISSPMHTLTEIFL